MLRLFRRLCCCSQRKPDPEELFIVTWKGGIQLEELENTSPAKEITSEGNLLVPAPPQLLTENSNRSDSPLHVANSNHKGDGKVEATTDNLNGTSMFQSIVKNTDDTLLKARSCLLFVESVEAIDASLNIEYVTNDKKDFTIINGHTVDEMAIDTSCVEQGASVPESIVKDIISNILTDAAQQILLKETEEIAKATATAMHRQFVDVMPKHTTGAEQGSNLAESVVKDVINILLTDAAQQILFKETEEIAKATATAISGQFVDEMPKRATGVEQCTNLVESVVKDAINSVPKDAAQQMPYKETEEIEKSTATAINRHFVDGMPESLINDSYASLKVDRRDKKKYSDNKVVILAKSLAEESENKEKSLLS